MKKEWIKANRELWQQRVQDFKQTSQTAIEWCRNSGIDYKSLLRWRRKLENEVNANHSHDNPIFREIVESSPGCPLIIELNKCKVHVPLNFNKQHLLECLQILGLKC